MIRDDYDELKTHSILVDNSRVYVIVYRKGNIIRIWIQKEGKEFELKNIKFACKLQDIDILNQISTFCKSLEFYHLIKHNLQMIL